MHTGARETIRVHILTPYDPRILLKQSPGFSPVTGNVELSFGLGVPGDIDVLIVHFYPYVSLVTELPRERIIYLDGEPDEVLRLQPAYLEQFGLVMTTSAVALKTRVHRANYCTFWFAGMNFDQAPDFTDIVGHDYFSALDVPPKKDRISIISARKADTDMHRLRAPFIRAMKERFPDKCDVFGFNADPLGDKREALLDHKYHVALENSCADFSWTEKLSDALLCWTFTFHAGCRNIADELPAGAFHSIDISNPEKAVEEIAAAIESASWDRAFDDIRAARKKILDHYNIIKLYERLANEAMSIPTAVAGPVRTAIRSELHFHPVPNTMTGRMRQTRRRLVFKLYPGAELLYHRIKFSALVRALKRPFKKIRFALRRAVFRWRSRRSHADTKQ